MIPPKRNATFVAAMEAVLDLYQAPPDPARPLICFDETLKELRDHLRPPEPMAPGRPAREDPEYTRAGSANLFMAVAPHLGWRHVTVTDRRTRVEWAQVIRDLVDLHFPHVEQLQLLLDNLNIHAIGSLYHTFPAAEAHRIASKVALHFTPVHGSWLNTAEAELHVLSQQCLERRIPDRETLEMEVAAWVEARNAARVPVKWGFGVDDARHALPEIYPVPVCNT